MLGRAAIALEQGDPAVAVSLLRRGLRTASADNWTLRADGMARLVRALVELKEMDEAEQVASELDGLLRRHPELRELDDDSFDLVVNRHMLQSIPRAEDVIRELCRVAKPGGRIHLLAEDYAMIHFHPVDGDSDRFWLSDCCRASTVSCLARLCSRPYLLGSALYLNSECFEAP